MRTLDDRLSELRRLLRKHKIGLTFTLKGLPPKAWRGFITPVPGMGWVIWLNSSLDRFAWAWVVAHELGHFCSLQQLGLLPQDELWLPPSSADQSDQKNWSRNRKADSNELAANGWAADLLVRQNERMEGERRHPCCLQKMSVYLEAPIEALYFGSRVVREGPMTQKLGRAHMSAAALAELRKPKAEKRGGVQDLIPNLGKSLSGAELIISRGQFYRLREYVAKYGGGGFGDDARPVMESLEDAILSCGGLGRFFT